MVDSSVKQTTWFARPRLQQKSGFKKEERKSGPPIQMTRITKELAHTRPTQCFSAVFWIGGEKQDH
jgi:hypothetical protein